MGCDTLVGIPEGDGIIPPCKLINVPRKEAKVLIVYSPPSPELVDKAEALAREKGASAIQFMVKTSDAITVHNIPLSDGIPPGFVVSERIIESGDAGGAKYELVRLEIAVCEKCPLNTPGRIIGVIAPPCSIRTGAYSDIAPTLVDGDVHDISVIDKLIEEAESYEPKDSGDAERRQALLTWLRTLKKYLRDRDVVLFNWC